MRGISHLCVGVVSGVVLVAAQACSSASAADPEAIGQTSAADTTVKQIPPTGDFQRTTPHWTQCSGSCCRDPRQIPWDRSIPFEDQLARWGCDAPYAYKPNPKAGPDNWWVYAYCPMTDPTTGASLGGVDYVAKKVIPGPLSDFVNHGFRNPQPGYTNVTPIWSMYPKMDATCVTMPPPPNQVIVGWDPKCPGGCGIEVY